MLQLLRFCQFFEERLKITGFSAFPAGMGRLARPPSRLITDHWCQPTPDRLPIRFTPVAPAWSIAARSRTYRQDSRHQGCCRYVLDRAAIDQAGATGVNLI